ncbi:hypothetical protein AAMO2058_000590400 [Amorphochlora amoebiformis]
MRSRNRVGRRMGNGYARAVTQVFGSGGKAGRAAKRTSLRQGELIVSSLRLQMLLYFDAYLSIALGFLSALVVRWKALVKGAGVTGIVFLSISYVVDFSRLYLGMVGNLKEKVPHFAGFFFLTLLQLFILVYLGVFQTILLPIDQVVNLISFLFAIAEIFLGFFGMRALIRNKTSRYDVEVRDSNDPNDNDDSDSDSSNFI